MLFHAPLRNVATEDVVSDLGTPLLVQQEDDDANEAHSLVSLKSNCSDEENPEDTTTSSTQEGYYNYAPINKSWVGPSLLLLVSFLYATLNICLRSLYVLPEPPSPSILSATRAWLILTMFLPILFHRTSQTTKHHSMENDTSSLVLLPSSSSSGTGTPEKGIWRVAAELAFWNFVGQALYVCGILFVSSARASFLGQTTVVMVPFISALGGVKLRCWAIWGCLCSLIGLILLSVQDNKNNNTSLSSGEYYGGTNPRLSLGVGEVLILISAICWSFVLIKTAKYAHVYDEVYLQGSKNAILAILYSGWCAVAWIQSDVSLWDGWQSGVAWAIIVYSAIGPGVFADLIQQKGQRSAGATESNLILCMESVFTAILGRVLLGEETSWIEKLGGAFLIAGAFVSGQ